MTYDDHSIYQIGDIIGFSNGCKGNYKIISIGFQGKDAIDGSYKCYATVQRLGNYPFKTIFGLHKPYIFKIGNIQDKEKTMTYESQKIAEILNRMDKTTNKRELNLLYQQADALLWNVYTCKGEYIRTDEKNTCE